jgi:hypothetical protein
VIATYSRIMNHSKHLAFPEDVEISPQARDIIRRFLSDASVRLGRNGLAEVKSHAFFTNPRWSFETIRQAEPPIVPELRGDDDTTHFEDVDSTDTAVMDNFQIPKAFTGNQLPFIGFTYSNELGPIELIRRRTGEGSDTTTMQLCHSNGINGGGGERLAEMERRHTAELSTRETEVGDLRERLGELQFQLEQERIAREVLEEGKSQLEKAKVQLERELQAAQESCEREAVELQAVSGPA